MTKIIFTVTNDLSYDQRMERICDSLHHAGFEIELIGRKKKNSLPILRPYKTTRLKLFFNKGKLFYFEYNLRLLFLLLFRKTDIFCAIDLDTITPNFLIAKLRNKHFVYDSHEYFTEVIEVVKRPRIKKIWEAIEGYILPKTYHAYTVNQSIADIYNKKYNTTFEVIRNAARLSNKLKTEATKPYLLYIGAVNAGRGLKEIILAMHKIDINLVICGDGDILDDLKELTEKEQLNHKIEFKGFVQPTELKQITSNAYLGYLLLEKESLSYYYSLANKFYDYIHAEIPQITSNFPEYSTLNEQFDIAELIDLNVENIINTTNNLINDKERYQELKTNTIEAKKALNWEQEEAKLITFYQNIICKKD